MSLDAIKAVTDIMGSVDEPSAQQQWAEYRQALGQLKAHGFCESWHYPWDEWERMALARGVAEELANLGRAVMREADQHRWNERLRSLCGWNDEGRRMIALGLRSPQRARRRWKWLLATDGLRVDPGADYRWVEDEGSWRRRRRRWLAAEGV
jgi:hypothetical protein